MRVHLEARQASVHQQNVRVLGHTKVTGWVWRFAVSIIGAAKTLPCIGYMRCAILKLLNDLKRWPTKVAPSKLQKWTTELVAASRFVLLRPDNCLSWSSKACIQGTQLKTVVHRYGDRMAVGVLKWSCFETSTCCK